MGSLPLLRHVSQPWEGAGTHSAGAGSAWNTRAHLCKHLILLVARDADALT